MQGSPTILVGLGETGVEIANEIRARSRESGPAMHVLSLRADGFRAVEDDPEHDAEDAPGATNETGARCAETADRWPDLNTEMAPGVWADNRERISEMGREIRRILGEAVKKVLRLQRPDEGELADVSASVNIFVVTTLADPVGSAVLRPLLDALGEVFERRFSEIQRTLHLLLLSPGLRVQSDGEMLRLARTYAFLQELEHALQDSAREAHLHPDLIWLLSDQNRNGQFVNSYRELLPMIASHVQALGSETIARDQSFAVVLRQRADGKVKRYSSFGSSQLIFPREALITSAVGTAVHDTLAELPARTDRRVPADEVYTRVHEFIREEELDQQESALKLDTEGQESWQPFAPPSGVLREEQSSRFLEEIDRYAATYEEQDVSLMRKKISGRRAQLFKGHREAIVRRVRGLLDQEEPGGLSEARAWLAALEGRSSEYIAGDTDSFPDTLHGVDQKMKAYFDQLFTPILFDEDEADAELKAYTNGKSATDMGRRALLQQLRFDLGTKRQKLEEAKLERKRLEEETDAADNASADGEKTSNGATSDDASPEEDEEMPEPGARSSARPRPDREVTPLQTRTTADEDKRRSAARSAEAQERSEIEQRKAQVEADITSYQEDIDRLEHLGEQVGREVALLDRIIEDASERRKYLASAMEDEQEAIEESKERYQKTARKERAIRAERSAHDETHTRWVLTAALPVLVGALLVGLAWWQVQRADTATAEAQRSVTSNEMVEDTREGFFQRVERNLWKVTAAVVVVSLLIGALIYALFFWRPRRAITKRLRAVREEKKPMRHAIARSYTQYYRTLYDHTVRGALVDWLDGMLGLVRDIDDRLEDLQSALGRREQRLQEEQRLGLPSSLFVDYAMPEDGVRGLLDRRAERLRMRKRTLAEDVPLSRVFAWCRSKAMDEAMDQFEEQMRAHLGEAFDDLREMSLEDFFASADMSTDARRRHVRRVYSHAVPFASLKQTGGTEAAPETWEYAGVAHPDGQGLVKSDMNEFGYDPSYYQSRENTKVTMRKLALGFPVFQFEPAMRGRYHLHELEDGERRGLYARPSQLDQLADLSPSVHRLGNASDTTRKAACLALAYGLAETRGKNAEGASTPVQFDGRSFASYEAWVQHLRSSDGNADRRQIEQKVRARREGNGEDAGTLRERLGSYRDRPGLDPTDRQIVDQEMNHYRVV